MIPVLRPYPSGFNRDLSQLSELTFHWNSPDFISEKVTNAWKTLGPKEARWEKPHFQQLSWAVLVHRNLYLHCAPEWPTYKEPSWNQIFSNSIDFIECLAPMECLLSSLNAHNYSSGVWDCPNTPGYVTLHMSLLLGILSLPSPIIISLVNSSITSPAKLYSPPPSLVENILLALY